MLMEGGQVAGLRKHPYGRVDQLEDRYLGMVEAPSSNLGTSTLNDFSSNVSGPCASTELEADVRIALCGVFQFLCRSVGLC